MKKISQSYYFFIACVKNINIYENINENLFVNEAGFINGEDQYGNNTGKIIYRINLLYHT